MALPSSGTLTLSQIQAEYGGSNPIEMSEYYRNGAYVPNSITTSVTVREPTSGEYWTEGSYEWAQQLTQNGASANYLAFIYWNGTQVYTGDNTFTGTSITIGSYTYYRGTDQGARYGLKGAYLWNAFGVYRTYPSSTTIYVNQSVPTSGTISISNFYGGRKT